MEQSLNKPVFPANWYQPARVKKGAAFLFLSVFIFLFLFRPFTVNEAELKYPFFLICFLHALSPALIVLVYFTILSPVYNKDSEKSTLSAFQLILSFIPLFFIIGIVSFLMRDLIYTNPDNWSFRYLWEEIRNAYLAGSLFTSYFLFAGFYFQSRKSQSNAAKQEGNVNNVQAGITSVPLGGFINSVQAGIISSVQKEGVNPLQERISNTSEEETINDKTEISSLINSSEIFVKAHVRIDDFSFNPHHFLFARAEGNYVELMMRNERGLKKELKRISLKQLDLQLNKYPCFIRSHRGYLINIQHVNHISGNSQGYLVSFEGIEDQVPVSRANLETFDQRYQQIKVNS